MTFEEAIAVLKDHQVDLDSDPDWATTAEALRTVLDVVAEWTTTATPDTAGEAS